MSRKRGIFVAGATGCVGGHIVQEILSSNPGVPIHVSYYRTKPFLKDKRLRYWHADFRRPQDSPPCVKGCDKAVFAAGLSTGAAGTALTQAQQIVDNVTMNMNLLNACAEAGVRRVVYIGSTSIYQEAAVPLKEEDLDWNLDPAQAYFGIGWGMRFIEKLCRFWQKKSGIETVIARATNIFGPFGKFDPMVSNVIPALTRKAVDRQDPFEVWGSPDVTRDVLYAGDFAQAVVRILDKPDLAFDVLNVGSGFSVRLADLVSWILAAAGHRPKEIRYDRDRPISIKYRAFDVQRARDVLGWTPATGVQEGLRKTVAWWCANKKTWKR